MISIVMSASVFAVLNAGRSGAKGAWSWLPLALARQLSRWSLWETG
jgi:hypothetical protein